MASFNAFTIRGIRIRIDQSWFIAFLLFAWTLSVGYFPFQAPNYSPFTYWVFGTLSSLGLFGCVLLHELSHCIVAQRLGVPVRQITLFIFGGVSSVFAENFLGYVGAVRPPVHYQDTRVGFAPDLLRQCV